MKHHAVRLLSLALALVLLTACGTAPAAPEDDAVQQDPAVLNDSTVQQAPELAAPPEQSMEERQAEFLSFLEEVNAQRRAIYEAPDPPQLDESWTSELTDMDHDFTQDEMDHILTRRDPVSVTVQEAREDVETAFRLLRNCYGAYDYFGGDEVFLPLRDAALAALPEEGEVTPETLEKALADTLSPVLVDGHFLIGSTAMRDTHARYMYYVPNLYLDFDDAAGIDPELVKPTIGEDGGLCLTLATLATPEESKALPDTLNIQGSPVSVSWVQDTEFRLSVGRYIESTAAGGIPLLIPYTRGYQERPISSGETYANAPVLSLDLRGNEGDRDPCSGKWLTEYTGEQADRHFAWGVKFSAFNRYLYQVVGGHSPDDIPETSQWGDLVSVPDQFVDREGLTLVLQDKGTGSVGETAIQNMRAMENTLIVGSNTKGSTLTLTNYPFYLPNSGVRFIFGTELCLTEKGEDLDGTGYPPDLWVPSVLAKLRMDDLIEYYDLTGLFA